MHSCLFGFDYSVFVGISKYNIHVLIEGKESAYHHATILHSQPDSEVNPLQELAPLRCHFIIDLL
jgi:hypothetical protein